MAATKGRINDDETSVTFEDQQQINTFARKNAKLQELKDEIVEKKKELQNLVDAESEVMMSDEELIPYQIGEVFVHLSSDQVQELIDKSKAKTEEDIKSLEAQSEEINKLLAQLKVKLYATFGDNINLEADE